MWDLDRPLEEDCTLSVLKFDDDEGEKEEEEEERVGSRDTT